MKKILKTLLVATLGAALISVASCGTAGSSTDTSTTSSTYASDITGTLNLTRSYTDKTFMSNGIEEATLSYCTDGDTSTFRLKSGNSITVRYLGIDTPESTASYDKWGKAASLWNASILTKATQIVLECNGTTPSLDSNGTRYLAFVWYKINSTDQWRNLNLETVENGYTNYTGTTSNVRETYHNVFTQALAKAKSEKIHIWGKDEDIYYPSTVNFVDLKELNNNYSEYYNDTTSVPTHVAFIAKLKSITTSSSGFINAVASQTIDGVEYTFDLTVGYSTSVTGRIFTSKNVDSYYYICGFTASGKTIHGLEAANTLEYDETMTQKLTESTDVDLTVSSVSTADSITTLTATSGSTSYSIMVINASDAIKALESGASISVSNLYKKTYGGYVTNSDYITIK